MKYLTTLLITLFVSGFTAAQQTTFSKVLFNTNAGFRGFTMAPFYDGGYIIAGGDLYDKSFMLRVDSLGNPVWNKYYTDKDGSVFNNGLGFKSVVVTYDSAVVAVTSYYVQAEEKQKGAVFKIDNTGDTVWIKTIGGDKSIYLNSVYQLYDSGFVACGYTGGTVKNIFVARFDKQGHRVWSKEYSSGYNSESYSIKETIDSCLFIAGYSYNNSTNFSVLLKLAGDGEIIWENKYYLSDNQKLMINDFEKVNFGFVVYSLINNWVGLMQIDSAGNIMWSKKYPSVSSNTDDIKRIHKTSDNGFVISTGSGDWGGFVLKTDSVGEPVFVSELWVILMDVIESSNGEYFSLGAGPLLLVGKNVPPQIGLIQLDSVGDGEECVSDYMAASELLNVLTDTVSFSVLPMGTSGVSAVDIDSIDISVRNGCVDVVGGVNENSTQNALNIFPNPSAGIFTVSLLAGQKGQLTIYNINGQKIFDKYIKESQTEIDLSKQLPGIYFYRFVDDDNRVFSGKVVIN